MSRATRIAVIGSVVRALTAGAAYGRRRMAVSLARVGVAAGLVLVLWAPALAQSGQIVEYYHLDALGSVRVVTDQAGQVIARHDFLPFGEEWNPPANAKEKKLFTGHERDAETGLDYFGARYYRPQVGRFTTIDPVYTWSENLVDPQRWNRYAYVLNNPLRHVDPDGRCPDGCVVEIAVVGGVMLYTTASTYLNSPGGRRQVGAVADGFWNLATRAADGVRSWFSSKDSGAQVKAGASQEGAGTRPPVEGARKLKGDQGWQDSDGNTWKKDQKHKDHWDVSDRNGRKIKEIDFEGKQIWPEGPKNKNKSK